MPSSETAKPLGGVEGSVPTWGREVDRRYAQRQSRSRDKAVLNRSGQVCSIVYSCLLPAR